jgi:hypothetical protein
VRLHAFSQEKHNKKIHLSIIWHQKWISPFAPSYVFVRLIIHQAKSHLDCSFWKFLNPRFPMIVDWSRCTMV